MAKHTVGVVGNPNSGKTTLFNALTGAKQRVGNWPGVTVERKTGACRIGDDTFDIVDLPGIYALSAHSLDEKVAREYVLSGEPDLIVDIVDASSFERNLYLALQLIEMRVPVIVALNMMDVVRANRVKIDVAQLGERLGCPVVPICARTGEGVAELRAAIAEQATSHAISPARTEYAEEIEQGIREIVDVVGDVAQEHEVDARWLAIKLLEDDEWALAVAGEAARRPLDAAKRRILGDLGDESDIAIADGRYGFINGVAHTVVSRGGEVRRSLTDALDRVVLSRLLGLPIFLVMMYLTFMVTINFGGCFIDFFDGFFGAIFVDGFGGLLGSVGSPDWLTAFLAGGIGGGIQTIATFIPPIALMFFCLAILEDSGYMARAAFVMDRLMRVVGLPGKSFVPMLVGFGCNVPAIMATRTLETRRDRLMTIMMNPFMSCGARLPVYALFGVAFFGATRGTLVFSLYMAGITFAVITGLILKYTLLRGEVSTFVMELPPYHIPTVRGVAVHTWNRLKSFMLRAGKVIMIVVVVLSALNSMGTDGSFGHEDSETSVLASIGRGIVPVFKPMGLREENWPGAVGLFTGIFAKEAVVGTLNALYTQMDTGHHHGPGCDHGKEEEPDEPFDFWGAIGESFQTIPDNLAETFGLGTLLDPLGFGGGTEDPEGVEDTAYAAMRQRFDGRVGAYAYLLFILLYMPCVAAIAAVYRETNLGWTVFATVYVTALAWGVSVGFYQAATIGRHAGTSVAWLAGLAAVFVIYIVALRIVGTRAAPKGAA
jgi:ferrous iron transport protein B